MRFDIDRTETDIFLTISLDGSSTATLTVDNLYRDGVKYKSGKTLTFYIEIYELKASNLASITIRNAEVGEYITISSHLFNATVPYEGIAP